MEVGARKVSNGPPHQQNKLEFVCVGVVYQYVNKNVPMRLCMCRRLLFVSRNCNKDTFAQFKRQYLMGQHPNIIDLAAGS